MDRASFTWISSLASLTCLVLVACNGGPIETTGTTDADTDPTTGSTTEGPDVTTTTVDPSTTEPTTSGTTEPETSTTEPTTDATSTGPAPDCLADDGVADEACDPATPFCSGGECVSCFDLANGDEACAGQSEDTPVCEQNSATCVECTPDAADKCSGATPICDELSFTCDKCTEHQQCGATACNLEAGICFPDDSVLYVDKNFADCDNSDGSEGAPFCAIQLAIDHAVTVNPLGSWTIWIAPGVYSQDVLETPGMGIKLALLGAGGGQVTVESSNNDQNAANFAVMTGDTVYMRNFNLSNHDTYHGFRCESGVAWIDDSRFNDNEQHGIYSIDCTLYMRRSVVYSNKSGGVVIHGTNGMDDPVSRIETSFITENGSPQATFGGLQVADNHNLDISYSSVLVNITNGGVSSLQCVNAGAVNIRNSLVIALAGQSFDCEGVVINNSAVDELVDAGMNNIMATAADVDAWFSYMNPGIYNAEAMVGDEPSPLTDLALWIEGDPRTDFNGDLRPMTDGSPTFPGADIPN